MRAVLFLAFVAVSGVLGSKPQLEIVWDEGARAVDAPVTELLVSGEDLKEEVIAAIDEYLNVLDQGYDEEISNECKNHVAFVGNTYLEINKKLPQIDFGIVTNFDFELRQLTAEFQEIVAIVKEGDASLSALTPLKSKASLRLENPLMKIKALYMKALVQKSRATFRYSLQQLFFGYKAEVLPRDFKELSNWQDDSFLNGHENVIAQYAEMEKNHRLDNLWTMVQQMQAYAAPDEVKDKKIEDHSTPSVWKNFHSAREDLLEVRPESRDLKRN